MDLIEALPEEPALRVEGTGWPTAPLGEPLPFELDPDGPLVGRERELSWLRGTWRQARRGRGRVVFVSGPAQIGKSRLAAEIGSFAHGLGASVSYAGAGGTAAAQVVSALRTRLPSHRTVRRSRQGAATSTP